MDKNETIFDGVQDTQFEKKEKLRKKNRISKVFRTLDRIFGFLIVIAIAAVIGGLGFEYVLVKGPSRSLEEKFINTMYQTRRFKFITNIFLSGEEINKITSVKKDEYLQSADIDYLSGKVELSSKVVDEQGYDAYGLRDEDGDGVIFIDDISYHGSKGYMLVILDPKRVFVGMPEQYGGGGLTLEDMCSKYDAIGGINAGMFIDHDGGGSGGQPYGITIVNGETYFKGSTGGVAGLNEDGILFVGNYSYEDCLSFGLRYAVSFDPVLIVNGEKTDVNNWGEFKSGIGPRTCIGQRADGAIVMLVIDGRQFYSIGVSCEDCADIMLSYGVVNAINMDGGSSSCMMYNGKLVNHPSNAAGGTRYLPTSWLFK